MSPQRTARGRKLQGFKTSHVHRKIVGHDIRNGTCNQLRFESIVRLDPYPKILGRTTHTHRILVRSRRRRRRRELEVTNTEDSVHFEVRFDRLLCRNYCVNTNGSVQGNSRSRPNHRRITCPNALVVLVLVRQLCRTRRTRFKPLALGHCKNSTPGFHLSKVVEMASVGGKVLLLSAVTVGQRMCAGKVDPGDDRTGGGVYISATPKTAIRHHEEES